jgi:hypothetical protein
MKDALAEKLLVRILDWDARQIAEQRPCLQALAAYKYDEYQQFSPGMRFMESLARWLGQFELTERRIAYQFLRERLLFFSAAEVQHWVEMAYPDHVRPLLLREVAPEAGYRRYEVVKVAESRDFKTRQRQCLFLGLSDGARIDSFRRLNPELSHEQICQTHELSPDRVRKLLGELAKDVCALCGDCSPSRTIRFRTVILLDDFSGSGRSYYRVEPDGSVKGKIAEFCQSVRDLGNPVSQLVELSEAEIVTLLYAATEHAIGHLNRGCEALWASTGANHCVRVVQRLPDHIRLAPEGQEEINCLIDRYYDHDVYDDHFEKGGTPDAKYGFAGCGLPLVLHHNTPNNSIALLWSYEDKSIRGLFPRITRHKEAT